MLGERMRECSLTGTRPLSTSRSVPRRSEEHTSELQSRQYLVCRLLLEKKKKNFELQPIQYALYRLRLSIKKRSVIIESRRRSAESSAKALIRLHRSDTYRHVTRDTRYY